MGSRNLEILTERDELGNYRALLEISILEECLCNLQNLQTKTNLYFLQYKPMIKGEVEQYDANVPGYRL